VAREIKAEAQKRAPETVRSIAAVLGPKLDEIVDGFADRLATFVAESGAALSRGIAEVLASALEERKRRQAAPEGVEADATRTSLALEQRLSALEPAIDDLREKVWETT
jgi:histidine ammonia-lyase